MPSQDILDRLFEVEKKAAGLLNSAREEADQRTGAARAEVEAARAVAYEKSLAALEAGLAAARRGAEEDFRKELEAFRLRLEGSPLDFEAFRREAGRLLGRAD